MTESLFDGILRCSRDGNTLVEHIDEHGRIYVCFNRARPSGCTSIDAEAIESELAARVLAVYASPAVTARIREAAMGRGAEAPSTTPQDLAEWYVEAVNEQRRSIIDAVLASVTVRPAVGDEPIAERFDVQWK